MKAQLRAGRQGRFRAFHDALYREQAPENSGALTEASLSVLAADRLGIDASRFRHDCTGPAIGRTRTGLPQLSAVAQAHAIRSETVQSCSSASASVRCKGYLDGEVAMFTALPDGYAEGMQRAEPSFDRWSTNSDQIDRLSTPNVFADSDTCLDDAIRDPAQIASSPPRGHNVHRCGIR